MKLTKKMFSIFLLVMTSLTFINPTFAEDGAGIGKIAMHISGDASAKNTYFLCVADFGCFSILASDAHKSFPTPTGSVNTLFAANMFTRRMYPQSVPQSCKIRLHNNQTLNIYGNLDASRSTVKINNLRCNVS